MSAVESEIDLPSEIADRLEEYNCPINMELMVEPVTLYCGHSFEKDAIEKWYAQRNNCPCCRADEQQDNAFRQSFRVNESLKDEIALFLEAHRPQIFSRLFVIHYILDAIHFHNYRFIMSYLKAHLSYLNRHIYEGNSILHLAILHRRYRLLRMLVSNFRSIDLNLITQHVGRASGETPLHLACKLPDSRILRFLVKRSSVDPQKADLSGDTPLIAAVKQRKVYQVAALLLSRKTDVNYSAEGGVPVIFSAIEARSDQILRLLLKNPKTDVNALGPMGQNPLFTAANKSYTNAVKLLLRREDINIESRCVLLQDRSALLIAHLNDAHNIVNMIAKSSKFEIFIQDLIKRNKVDTLIKNLADLYKSRASDCFYSYLNLYRSKVEPCSLFRFICFNSGLAFKRFVRKLLSKIVADVIDKKDFGCLASFITWNPYLLNRGFSNGGLCLLHYAVRKKSFEMVEFLTELRGIDLNKSVNTSVGSHGGFRAMHFAAALDSPRILELLLKKGANARVRDWYGVTPYTRAVTLRKHENSRLLARYRR